MRRLRKVFGLVLLLTCSGLQAASPTVQITVTGRLARVLAIGAESTGWAVQLDERTPAGGKEVTSIEVKFKDAKQGKKYENKRVKVKGTVTYRHGVETGDVMVLEVTSINGLKPAKPTVKA